MNGTPETPLYRAVDSETNSSAGFTPDIAEELAAVFGTGTGAVDLGEFSKWQGTHGTPHAFTQQQQDLTDQQISGDHWLLGYWSLGASETGVRLRVGSAVSYPITRSFLHVRRTAKTIETHAAATLRTRAPAELVTLTIPAGQTVSPEFADMEVRDLTVLLEDPNRPADVVKAAVSETGFLPVRMAVPQRDPATSQVIGSGARPLDGPAVWPGLTRPRPWPLMHAPELRVGKLVRARFRIQEEWI